MQGSLDAPPIVVTGGRARGAMVLGVSLLLTVLIVMGLQDANGPVLIFVLGACFCGLGVLGGLALMIWPPRLEITPEGLMQRALWRKTRLAWSDVRDFRPATIGLRTAVVGFDHVRRPGGRQGLRNFNAAVSGAEGVLQPGLGKPQVLADLLNEARARWLDQAAAVCGGAEAVDERPRRLRGFTGARLDRRSYWIAVAALVAAAAALSYIPGLSHALGGIVTLVFIRIFAVRLHDIGRSGWWQLLLYLVQVIGGVATAMVTGTESMLMPLAVMLFLQSVFTLVLGLMPGQPGSNRFGPPPGALLVSGVF